VDVAGRRIRRTLNGVLHGRSLAARWRARDPARMLRLACPCAACREEMTGRPLLDPARVPEDIDGLAVQLVGAYGIRIDWSDGHNTGIYAYEMLRRMCPCEKCAAERGATGR